MTHLGIGVMLHMLGGNAETVNVFQAALGKEIANLELIKGGAVDGVLRFTFTDGTAMELYDDGQSCCESRWMHTDDKLDDFVGATLIDAEVRNGPTEDGEYGEPKESQFLVVTTSKGQFTVVNYNEHNGYYGGFWLVARDVAAD